MDAVLNVDKLQRMNLLVKELERHGMARENAVSEAESILSRETKIEEVAPPPMFPQSAAKVDVRPEPAEPPGSAMLEAKYQYLFEQAFKRHSAEMEELKAHLSRMSTEMDMLRADLRSLASQQDRMRAAPMPAHAPVQVVEAAPKPQFEMPAPSVQPEQPRVAAEPEKKSQHPRQGNYKPEDVSMEKFFYFGHK